MKTSILMLSKSFPAKHPRAGESTFFEHKLKNQLEGNINDPLGCKKHTIRGNFNGGNFKKWKTRIEKILQGEFALSIREWEDKPYNSQQRIIFHLDHSTPLGYQRISMRYDQETKSIRCVIDGRPFTDINLLAANDGLSFADFSAWFFAKGKAGLFQGVIIHFTDMRY